MDKIIFPIKKELEIFEKKLEEIILNETNFLTYDLKKFIFSSPKRLRPIFIFLFSKVLKIENEKVYDIALTTELIHSASLIHDDIIDEEKIRRKHPTFFDKYNSKIAVLEGDLLLSFALNQIAKTNMDILKIFAKRIKDTIQAEIIQNENLNKIYDIDYYLKKTKEKTANLFIVGLEALFCLKEINLKIKENILSFIENYSIAFQIKNDIDNFMNNSSDYKNGNYTLPVIYFFMENNTAEFNQRNENFEKYIQKSYKKVEEYKLNAVKSLDVLENSEYKEALIKLTNETLRSQF